MIEKNTTKNNLISIIIPTFNRIENLQKVIGSYLIQDYLKEIIIIDDASTDDTEKIVQKLSDEEPWIKYFKNNKNLGTPASRNMGVSLSEGSFIFFGEDDIVLQKNHLLILMQHLHKENADIIAGRCISLRPGETKEEGLKRSDNYRSNPVNYRLLLTNFQVPADKDIRLPVLGTSMLIKKEVFKEVRYDENYRRNAWREETDFQLSAGRKGFNLYFCPHTACFHLAKIRNRGGARSSSFIKYEVDIFRFNYYMTRKHWDYIKTNFKIKNIYSYMFIFVGYIILHKNILPFLGKIKGFLVKKLLKR